MRPGTTLRLVPFLLGVVLTGPALGGSWSLPDEARGLRIQPLFLLSRPDVRADRGLPADQAESIDREIVEVFRQAAALTGRTDPGVVADRRAVDERAMRWIHAHLSAEQVTRLNQLELHWEGLAALTYHESVSESLSLSDEQRATLAKAVAVRRSRRGPGFDATAEEQRFTQTAMAALSDHQRKRWEQALGRPFLLRPVAATATAAPANANAPATRR